MSKKMTMPLMRTEKLCHCYRGVGREDRVGYADTDIQG
jgi:hypothetical protein